MVYSYQVQYNFRSVLVLYERFCRLEIGLDHLLHQRVKVHLALPSKDTLSFCRVTEKQADREGGDISNSSSQTGSKQGTRNSLNLRWTEVPGVNLDQNPSSFSINALLANSRPSPSVLNKRLGSNGAMEESR